MHSNAAFRSQDRYVVRFGNVPHLGDYWSARGNTGRWDEHRAKAVVYRSHRRAWAVCHNLGRWGTYARIVRLVPRSKVVIRLRTALANLLAVALTYDLHESHGVVRDARSALSGSAGPR